MGSGEVTVATLGTNEVMLSGNVVAICSSGLIHAAYSMIFPQNFDFSSLDSKIKLVENDTSGLGAEEQDPEMLEASSKWIVSRGWVLTIVLVVIWPLLSIPAGKFTKDYFAFWVLVAIAWGFGAAIIITFLPIIEASGEIGGVVNGMMGKSAPKEVDDEKGFDDDA